MRQLHALVLAQDHQPKINSYEYMLYVTKTRPLESDAEAGSRWGSPNTRLSLMLPNYSIASGMFLECMSPPPPPPNHHMSSL